MSRSNNHTVLEQDGTESSHFDETMDENLVG
jgi:hypothetical protein